MYFIVSILKKKCRESHQTHRAEPLFVRGIIQCKSVLSWSDKKYDQYIPLPQKVKLEIIHPALSLLYSKLSTRAASYSRSGAQTICSDLAQYVKQCSVVPVSGTSKGYLTTNKYCKLLVCSSQRTNNDRKQKFVAIWREAKQAASGRKRGHHTSRAPCSSGRPTQTYLIARDTLCRYNHLLTQYLGVTAPERKALKHTGCCGSSSYPKEHARHGGHPTAHLQPGFPVGGISSWGRQRAGKAAFGTISSNSVLHQVSQRFLRQFSLFYHLKRAPIRERSSRTPRTSPEKVN